MIILTAGCGTKEEIPQETKEYEVYITLGDYRNITLPPDEQLPGEGSVREKRRMALMTELENRCGIHSYPNERLQAMEQAILTHYEKYVSENFGQSLTEYASDQQISADILKEQLHELAQRAVFQQMIVEAIAWEEEIGLNETELEAGAEEYGYQTYKAMKEELGEEESRIAILTDKVLDSLIAE